MSAADGKATWHKRFRFTEWERLVMMDTSLSVHARFVGMWLGRYGRRFGFDSIRPGAARIAAELGVNRKTPDKALTSLRAAGYLEVVRRGNVGLATTWRLTFPPKSGAPGLTHCACAGLTCHTGKRRVEGEPLCPECCDKFAALYSFLTGTIEYVTPSQLEAEHS